MKQQIKKLAEDLHNALEDANFESFIAQQFLSNKNDDEDGPLFSITNRDTSIDVWIKGHQYVMVKSILPGSSARMGFTKKIKKVDELLNEIQICLIDFLNVPKD